MRRIVAGAALTVTALAGLGLTASAASASPAAKPVARCHNADVKITLTPAPGEVGMMKTGWILRARNTSHHACYVDGYANLVLQNAKHKAIHTEEQKGSTWFVKDPGAHRIVLRPGGSVVADLAYAHIRQQGTEHPSYLRIALPGEKAGQTVPLTDPWVFRGQVSVTAFAGHLTF